MLDEATEQMSAELAAELAANNRRLAVDPRTLPVRFSHLKAMGQSPAHCLAAFQDYRSNSMAIRMGAGVHAMAFDQPCVKFEGKVRNGGKWEEFKAKNAGAAILNAKEHAKAEAICSSLKSHAIASRLLFKPGAIREQTIMWEQNGRARRSTPDIRGDGYVVELKSTRCAEPGKFVRDSMFRAYHGQLADQCEAIKCATGRAPEAAYIVAIESVEPYAVQVFQLTPRALEKGARLCRLWLERLLVCEATNSWPPYSLAIEPFDVADDLELSFAEPEDPDWVKGDEP